VGGLEPRNPFPDYLDDVEARMVNEMRFRLTKILKEFNRRAHRCKAVLKLGSCLPAICGDTKIVLYHIELVNPEDDSIVAYTTFKWNLTKNMKNYLSTVANSPTTLEDTLNITSLTAQLAKEFYLA
jgi:hypothetical protein